SDDMPTVKDLMEFLEKEAWVFLAAGPEKVKQSDSNSKEKTKDKRKNQTSSHHGSTSTACANCSGQHTIEKCDAFLKMTVDERFSCLKNKGATLNVANLRQEYEWGTS
ncbi:unnamed protein product, partial [Allacma fusca]